jgi:hypothetical protein
LSSQTWVMPSFSPSNPFMCLLMVAAFLRA